MSAALGLSDTRVALHLECITVVVPTERNASSEGWGSDVTEASAQAQRTSSKRVPQQRPILVTGVLARLEGFEPPTNGFGSHYSIRLSYRRVFKGLFPANARAAEQWPCATPEAHCRG